MMLLRQSAEEYPNEEQAECNAGSLQRRPSALSIAVLIRLLKHARERAQSVHGETLNK